MSVPLLTGRHVEAAVSPERAVEAVREAFIAYHRGEWSMPPKVYVPAYRSIAGSGWFTAIDTGGAIKGRHIDVYRPPPSVVDDRGRLLRNQRVLVVPPGA